MHVNSNESGMSAVFIMLAFTVVLGFQLTQSEFNRKVVNHHSQSVDLKIVKDSLKKSVNCGRTFGENICTEGRFYRLQGFANTNGENYLTKALLASEGELVNSARYGDWWMKAQCVDGDLEIRVAKSGNAGFLKDPLTGFSIDWNNSINPIFSQGKSVCSGPDSSISASSEKATIFQQGGRWLKEEQGPVEMLVGPKREFTVEKANKILVEVRSPHLSNQQGWALLDDACVLTLKVSGRLSGYNKTIEIARLKPNRSSIHLPIGFTHIIDSPPTGETYSLELWLARDYDNWGYCSISDTEIYAITL